MTRQGTFLLGMVAGAGLMYLLDPDRGRRRRALIRDQVVHGVHELDDLRSAAASRARDLRNRARGVVHESRARLRPEVVDDPVLEARVRSVLGRRVSHPGQVDVSADHGRLVLTGRVLATDLATVVAAAERVPGVREVVNRLQTVEPSGATGAQDGGR